MISLKFAFVATWQVFAMANVEDFIARLSADNPGLDNLIFQIASLVSTHPPPFIYVNDPTTSRITSDVVNTVLSNFSDPHSELAPHQQTRYAHVNAVACFTPRLFYDTVLNSLANWHVNWDDGCENWAPEGEKPARNESLDSFIHGLKALHASLVKSHLDSGSTSKNSEEAPVKMVISITRAERLKESMPELIVPLTRLAELVRLLPENKSVSVESLYFSDQLCSPRSKSQSYLSPKLHGKTSDLLLEPHLSRTTLIYKSWTSKATTFFNHFLRLSF